MEPHTQRERNRIVKPGSRHRSGALLDGDGRLADAVLCRNCRYNLRGVDVQSNCPECGKRVDATLIGDLLQFANPAWLKKVRLGFTVLFIAMMLSVIETILPYLLRPLLGFSAPTLNGDIDFDAIMEHFRRVKLLLWCVSGFVACTYIIGYALMTTSQVVDGKETLSTAGHLARWLSIMSILLDLGINATELILEYELSLLVSGIMWSMRAIGIAAMLIYWGELANRMLANRLEKTARQLLWSGLIIGVTSITLTAITAINQNNSGLGEVSAAIVLRVLAVGAVTWAAMYLYLLFGLRSRLRKTIALSDFF